MGYTTSFTGKFTLDKQLTLDHYRYLKEFAEKDHRDEDILKGDFRGFYCQWIPTEDGRAIEWDGGEKFYDYVEWLKYLIDKFLVPNGYNLNGCVQYQGEEVGDCGTLLVNNCVVTTTKYSPTDNDLISLVKKGLESEENQAWWYLQEIAKKLKIEQPND